jgi:hypothetical protein
VNLEAPFERTALGVDSTDGGLDVLVTPERAWAWKNKDLMAPLVQLGIVRDRDIDGFLEAGEEAIARLESASFPFDGSYLDWLPPAEWTTPRVPAGWETIPDYDLNRITGRRIFVEPPARTA